jgi:hypothetical protein
MQDIINIFINVVNEERRSAEEGIIMRFVVVAVVLIKCEEQKMSVISHQASFSKNRVQNVCM